MAMAREFFISGRFHETKIGRGEAADIGKDGGQIAGVHAEPGGDGGEILVNRGGRDPATGARVVGAIDSERGKRAVGFSAVDRTMVGRAGAAHDEMMAAPAMIAADSVAWKRAAKIARGGWLETI